MNVPISKVPVPKVPAPISQIEGRIVENVAKRRQTYAERFPLLFALGATFGLVSTLYGFEKLIDKVDLFVNHPWILLIVGVMALTVTGTLYKKIG